MNLFEKIAKENDNSGLGNTGLGALTLGGLGAGAYYGNKKTKSEKYVNKAKQKLKEIANEYEEGKQYLKDHKSEDKNNMLSNIVERRRKNMVNYEGRVVDRLQRRMDRFNRNSKLGLAAAGLGALGLGYNLYKNKNN